ncbi:hypothetical protein ILUMI_15978, partial [Ignelater luminosus]
ADADWGGDQEDRKSNAAYMFFYRDGLIRWSSRKQTCVSLSSTEAEYISLAEACQEAIPWLQMRLPAGTMGLCDVIIKKGIVAGWQ